MSYTEFIEWIDGYIIAFTVLVTILSSFAVYMENRKQKREVQDEMKPKPPPTVRLIIPQTAKQSVDKVKPCREVSQEKMAVPFVKTELTEEEQQEESFLPIEIVAKETHTRGSVNVDEIDNLIRVMAGIAATHREEMAAYTTVDKIIDTRFLSEMLSKMEGAKQNLTAVFSKIASSYNDPTSVNPYRIYEGVDYLPLKRK